MQKIDKTDTLETILTRGKFEVDYYQREYRWGRKQIEQMLRPLRKFCVSDFRQKQEYHMYAVHDGAYSPCLPLSREGGTVCAPLAA